MRLSDAKRRRRVLLDDQHGEAEVAVDVAENGHDLFGDDGSEPK